MGGTADAVCYRSRRRDWSSEGGANLPLCAEWRTDEAARGRRWIPRSMSADGSGLRMNYAAAAAGGGTEVRRLVECGRAECLLSSASRMAACTDTGNALTAGDALAAELRRTIESTGGRALRTAGRDRADLSVRRRTLRTGLRAKGRQRVRTTELCA